MPTRPPFWLRVAVLSAIYAIPILAALRPVLDWDLWWHLRTGQWIVEHDEVPATDPFSAYGEGRPWVAYSWLFEVVVYRFYLQWGLAGVVLLRALMGLAVVVAIRGLAARAEPRFLLVSSALTAVAALALLPLSAERPWHCTIFLCAVTLRVLLGIREGKAWWMLPPLFALWSNLHIQFVLGLMMIGLALTAALLRASRTEARQLAILLFLCAAATLANPYGFQVWEVVREYATHSVPSRIINELKPPDFRFHWDWLVLALLILGLLGVLRRGAPPFETLLLAVSAVFWLRSRRDFWLVVLAALPLLPALLPKPATGQADGQLCFASPLAVLLALLFANVWRTARELDESRLREAETELFPRRAATVLVRQDTAAVLYNDLNWGGYLIWKLPRCKVAMDGRTNLHGDERLARGRMTWDAQEGWQDDPELDAAEIVVAEKDAPLTDKLRRDERFAILHEDAQAVLFRRVRRE